MVALHDVRRNNNRKCIREVGNDKDAPALEAFELSFQARRKWGRINGRSSGVRISHLPLCCVSFSAAPTPLLVVPVPPWLPPRPASRACGTTPRCSALANETRLDVPARSSPAIPHKNQSQGGRRWEKGAYVHDVVEYYERCPFCLWFVPDAYLSDAAVAAEKVIQVLARDLIVQILDEEYAVGAGWQLGLRRYA